MLLLFSFLTCIAASSDALRGTAARVVGVAVTVGYPAGTVTSALHRVKLQEAIRRMGGQIYCTLGVSGICSRHLQAQLNLL
jgi:hypothetical protein